MGRVGALSVLVALIFLFGALVLVSAVTKRRPAFGGNFLDRLLRARLFILRRGLANKA